MNDPKIKQSVPDGIAIIGMAGRFPGAGSIAAFWENLKNGVDSISRFEEDELELSVRSPDDPGSRSVRARAILDGVDLFDAEFFGIVPSDAEKMDPQHRLFLECSWEALEAAGYDPAGYPGPIGLYAGASLNTYLLYNLCSTRQFIEQFTGSYQVGSFSTLLGNDKDFVPTRVSYKLDLKGPSVAVQTACSTSLVAVCHAVQSLLTHQCDMALAGGVSITFPQKRDYLYQEDAMASLDGTCRAFDTEAKGTVFGHGVGAVVLKRLADALADGDHIHAVIKGTAVNNDGAQKVGYAAPSVGGQAGVIAMAQAFAGVDPRTVSYIEAHGTGTPLGDPIEVAALTQAFRLHTDDKGFCGIGTAKTNVGHLDAAAGVTGLIKTALSLENRLLPPLVHFKQANPKIDFANSPFYPVTHLTDWKANGQALRRAGVSAFGVGGTNAHVVVEEAPASAASEPSRPCQVLLLSARSAGALDQATRNLAGHLRNNPDLNLADVAHTLQRGRRKFEHRRIVVCRDAKQAVESMETGDPKRVSTRHGTERNPPVAFLLPGQGIQHIDLARGLYRNEPGFRREVDTCAEILRGPLGFDLREIIYPTDKTRDSALERIHQTAVAQPAIFVLEYALARLWICWGIRPESLIGHSVGEYVAAVLAGVFSLEDTLGLLAARAALMQDLPKGSMLAVRLPADQLAARLNGKLSDESISVAALNSPTLSVVSGPKKSLDAFQAKLAKEKIAARWLSTSHAFHSAMMDPVVAPFTELVRKIKRSQPQIPWVSTLTGRWVEERDMEDPAYWARQLRHTVRFSDAISLMLEDPRRVLLEVGPGRTLSTLVGQHKTAGSDRTVIASLPSSEQPDEDFASMLGALGKLWIAGVEIDWDGFYQVEKRRRVVLPTYPFERKRHWIEPNAAAPVSKSEPEAVQAVTPQIQPAGDRRERLVAEVTALIAGFSGLDAAAIDPAAGFAELGLDSLILTQVSLGFQKKFSLKITFRQLTDDLSTIAAVVAHLDANLPGEQTSATPAPLDQIAGQLQSLQRQLDALRQGEAAPQPAKTPARHGPFKPIDKVAATDLSAGQRKALDTLIERYNGKTKTSKAYAQEHRGHFCDPRGAAGFRPLWKEMVYPIVSARSKGSRIWDVDGNEYVDVTLGFGANFLGHSPDYVVRALEDQLRLGVEIGPQSRLAGEVARMICEMTGLERATFCNTGSEAVLAAMRIARTVTGRDKIVFFTGDYHGIFDEVLARAATVDGRAGSMPIAPGIPSQNLGNVMVLEYGDARSLEILSGQLSEIAAVMVEPVQARHPDLQPAEFLRELRRMTESSGTALIFDEVITGFRCHPGGAQALFGVRADLATYGKVVGGGMPIGVVAGSAKYMDVLDGGAWSYGNDSVPEVGVTFFAGTFVRHPLAIAAAHAVMKHLKASGPGLQQEAARKTERLAREVNRAFGDRGIAIRIQQFSSVFYLDFPVDLPHAALLFYHLRDRGVHVWEGRCGFISTAHTDADIDFLIRAFTDSINEMQQAGFLTGRGEQVPGSTPLTPAQREIWLATQMGDDANCAYNESSILHLRGRLDAAALRTALQAAVDRHDAFRSTFDAEGQTQIYAPAFKIEPILHDFSGLSAGEGQQRVADIMAEESGRPFDLVQGPLVRTQLVKLTPEHHLLLFTAHHLVCDGWSFGALLHELSALYNAALAGQPAGLQPAMQFREFAQTQAARLLGPDHQNAESYWLSQFSESVPSLELPTDRPRPAGLTYEGAMESLKMDQERFRLLKNAGAKAGNTLFVTLFSAFSALIHRLSGQDELVVGIPAAGQAFVGANALVGHCLNFLPIRSKLDDGISFSEFSRCSKRLVVDAYDHQTVTFGDLLQKLKVPRPANRMPLISASFNIDRGDYDKLNFRGLNADIQTNPKLFVNFDLFFNLVQTTDNLEVECEYNTNLFDRETIRRWLSHYEQLIQGVIEQPDQPISDVSLLDEAERHRVLVEWNRTETGYPRTITVNRLFEQQVEATPDNLAVVFENRRLTYRELNEQANLIAWNLLKQGVLPNSLVGLCAERSPEMLIGMLGILKAGGAYLPLDPLYPRERLAYMLGDSGARILLAQRSALRNISTTDSKVIILEDLIAKSADARSDIQNPNSKNTPENLAYVIYTSGSSGRPKGVPIQHGNLCNLIFWHRQAYDISSADRATQLASPAFDASVWEIWPYLTAGASLHIPEELTRSDVAALVEWLAAQKITVSFFPTPLAEAALQQPWPETSVLRVLLTGGDKLHRHPPTILPFRLVNHYGPTENTVVSTCAEVLTGVNGEAAPPIGRPLPNTKVYVLDRHLQPVPIGVPGELHVGGAQLTQGYWNRPELTSRQFISLPFLPNQRVYNTGDRVRYREDGQLEFLGRVDDQVKIRGFRIELGEIESVLQLHPSVKDCVVAIREDKLGQKKLVGYVVAGPIGESNDGKLVQEMTEAWELQYQDAIAQASESLPAPADPSLEIYRWSGVSNSESEVNEWINITVNRIQALRPKHVLELGCGTGLVTMRLAPGCTKYHATDFSTAAIDNLREKFKQLKPSLPHVTLAAKPADDFSDVKPGSYDAVVINSVVEFFPSMDYLLRVIEGSICAIGDRGFIFLGDVPNFALLDVYHFSDQLAKSKPSMGVGEFEQLLARRQAKEKRLLVHPHFFQALQSKFPSITGVEVKMTRGRFSNRQTKLHSDTHYDVIFRIGGPVSRPDRVDRIEWTPLGPTPSSVRSKLAESGSDAVVLTGVPFERLQVQVEAAQLFPTEAGLKTISDMRRRLDVEEARKNSDLEPWWTAAKGTAFSINITWPSSDRPGTVDVIYSRVSGWSGPNPDAPLRPLSAYVNKKISNQESSNLPAELRNYLNTKLPDYMIPSAFVIIERLPLTANGKVDRRALPVPAPDQGAFGDDAPALPQTDLQQKLARIWQEVLDVPQVGLHDNFFELGGDSILCFQVTSRAKKQGLAVTPRLLFQHQTIASLASVLEIENGSESEIKPADRITKKAKRPVREEAKADVA